MSELESIFHLWKREMLVFFRQKSRIASSLVMPMLWLFIFGSGMGGAQMVAGISYQDFLFPGILAMSLVFVCVGSGVSVIWDRDFGFLKETLVAPISRTSLLLGKVLGTVTVATIQASLVLTLAFLGGIQFNIGSLFFVYPLLILVAVGLVSLGLTIASKLESMEGFHAIMNFIIMPMFFLSGALYPIDRMPEIVRPLIFADPLTYGVDALRSVMGGYSFFPLMISLSALLFFDILMLVLGSRAFSNHK